MLRLNVQLRLSCLWPCLLRFMWLCIGVRTNWMIFLFGLLWLIMQLGCTTTYPSQGVVLHDRVHYENKV
ncbi:hypothetical protein ACHAW6_010245 [Cyclotella cf. meneghiniana]